MADDPGNPSDAGQPLDGRTWIGELDGLRGIAALTVMLAHFHPGGGLLDDWVLRPGVALLTGFSAANLGVVFFYALSSFLLTYLAVREIDRTGGFGVIGFYLRRLFRIWPLYFTVLLVDLWLASPASLVVPPARPDDAGWNWIVSHLWLFGLFLSNWSIAFNAIGGYVDHATFPLGVLWSIAIEEQFYLFYPWVIGAALATMTRARLTALILIAVGLLFRTAFMLLPVDKPDIGPAGGLYYATFSYLDIFVAGGTAGLLAARNFSPAPWLLRMLRTRGFGAALAVLIVGIGWVWGGQVWYPYAWYTPLIYPVTGVVFALTILWTCAHPGLLLSRVLRTRALRTLGTLSFGVYLWHPAVILLIQRNFSTVVVSSAAEASFIASAIFALYLIGTIGMACLSFGLVERPALIFKERFARDGVQGRSRSLALHTPQRLWLASAAGALAAMALVEVGVAGYLGAATSDRIVAALPVRPYDEPLRNAASVSARYAVADKVRLGIPVTGEDGRETAVRPGDVVLHDASGQLFRVGGDDRATRIVGPEGSRVRISNVGNWSADQGRVAGLDAVMTAGRWQMDVSALPSIGDRGIGLTDEQAFQTGGWQLSLGGPAPTMTTLADEGGPFLRFTVTAPDTAVTVLGPPVSLGGQPVTLLAFTRVSRPVPETLVLYDRSVDGAPPTVSVERAVGEPAWRPIMLRVPTTAAGQQADSFTIGATDLMPGDTLDIRDMRVIGGLLPGPSVIAHWGRTERLGLTGTPRVLAVPASTDLAADLLVSGPEGRSTPLAADDLLLSMDTGALWRLEPARTFTRLLGQDGQKLLVQNLGNWDGRAGRLRGLSATFMDGRWQLDDGGLLTANANPYFRDGSPSQPLAGWELTPTDGFEASRVDEGGQPVVRVRATRQLDELTLRAPSLTAHAGWPSSVRAQVRVAGGAQLSLTLGLRDGANQLTRLSDDLGPGEGWRVLHVIGPSAPNLRADDVSLTLRGLAAGDVVDLREVGLFLGVAPGGQITSCCPLPLAVLRPDIGSGALVLAVPSKAGLLSDTLVPNHLGVPSPLPPDALLLARDTSTLWQRRADGVFVRLIGEDEQTVLVANVGVWDAAAGRLAGLSARFVEERWHIDSAPMQPVAALTLPAPGAAPFPQQHWWISPHDAPFAARVGEEEGVRFLHVETQVALETLFVTSDAVVPSVGGAPISIRAVVRSSRPMVQSLVLNDTAASGQPQVVVERQPSDRQWTTLTLRSRPVVGPSDGDNVTVGIQGAQAGDGFDVQALEIYVGLLP